MSGKVFLVGAGPGDYGLLTLRGRELIASADVVVYDALVGQGVINLIPDTAIRIDVGKRAGNHPVPQEKINQILLEQAGEGRRVVRLKGGDPFLFGRGGEELELLSENKIPFEVVPGITSAIAVPAYAGIPVTHRDFCSSVHIITGHTRKSPGAQIDYDALARLGGTLVFLMGVGALEEICSRLLEAGMPSETPAAVLERVTTARQRRVISSLTELPKEAARLQIESPAVIVVGEVCSLSDQLCWAEKRPLGGKRVLVTRPRTRASSMADLLRDAGAEVLLFPAISTVQIDPNPEFDEALLHLKRYSWIAFTSPTGVEVFFNGMRARGLDIRRLAGLRLAAIGSATAEALKLRGLMPDLVPSEYSGAALGRMLVQYAAGSRVLLARASEGTPDLTDALKAGGITYDDLPIYRTSLADQSTEETIKRFLAEGIDYAAFTSASTVHGFARAAGYGDFSGFTAVCIGRSTERAALEYGMRTAVSPKATMESMLDFMIQLAKEENKTWNS